MYLPTGPGLLGELYRGFSPGRFASGQAGLQGVQGTTAQRGHALQGLPGPAAREHLETSAGPLCLKPLIHSKGLSPRAPCPHAIFSIAHPLRWCSKRLGFKYSLGDFSNREEIALRVEFNICTYSICPL